MLPRPANGGQRRPGRDRRAVLHPAPAGHAGVERLVAPPRVAVVGGGIAGVAAAVALAERGVGVELLERDGQLGGRVSGWPTTLADGSRVTMNRGFHAFFRQYYNLRALLRRVGAPLTPLRDYPLVDAHGHRDTFVGLPRTPPWNALAFAARSPTFSWRDLVFRIEAAAALPLVDVSVPEIYQRLDGIDAMALLERIRFPPAARHLAFSVFSRSFFADARELSAAELAAMFHIYFLGSSEGLIFDVTAEPFPQAVWDPMVRYLHSCGAQVRTGTAVQAVVPGRMRRFALHTGSGGSPGEVDAVVLACDVGGLRSVVEASDLGDSRWRQRIAGLRNAPPFLVSRFWLDRPVRGDRPGFLGTAGFGPVDNVSVLERYEGESRRWAARCGGSVVEVHAYALPEGSRVAGLREEMLAQLYRLYPETAHARIVDERHELRSDCPLFAAGSFADRPPVTTPDPAVVLAGDLSRIDLPVALMERAATSGVLAANALLARWDVRGHAVWTVPTRGRLALLR
ncbi:MAG: FAD-dependent oxidoreductase, partial [Pseudonocardiaceae bacterium]|nr:FAD-dependent oxidoreductase [Pseudonocardiaceae bacterium]